MVHIFGKRPAAGGAPPAGVRAGAASPTISAKSSPHGAGYVVDVTTDTFESVVIRGSLKIPVLVDLWAEWCGPCKELGPRLENVARKSAGAFLLAKVDVEANQEIAAAMGVRSIPMVALFVSGRPVDAFMGAVTEREIEEFLSKHISLKAAPAEEKKPGGAAAALAVGDISGAKSQLTKDDDPILAATVLVLSGDFSGAKVKVGEVSPDSRISSTDKIESLEILIKAGLTPENPIEKLLLNLSSSGCAAVIDELLASRDQSARPILLAILILLGRGEFSDGYRTRLARTLFS